MEQSETKLSLPFADAGVSMRHDAPNPCRWSEFYKVRANRPPRELFQQTMARFKHAGSSPGFAVDLGCGTGIETLELLHQGWSVLAVDYTPEAIAQVRACVARCGVPLGDEDGLL